MRFRPLPAQNNTICMRFCFDPLSRAFENRCVFDEDAQRISVEGRVKRIETYAFSNENALVWTGPNFYHIICYLFSKLIHSHTFYCKN